MSPHPPLPDTAAIPSLVPLASLSTTSTTRAWQSVPHPYLSLLATATSDKTVTIHSLRDFRLLSTISGGHKRSIRSVAWKDTGSGRGCKDVVLATGSFDSNVGIWTKNNPNARTATDDDIDLAANGITGGGTTADEEEWTFTSLLTGPDSEIKSIAFSPTSPHLLATSSRDKSVWIWEDVSQSPSNPSFSGSSSEEYEYETVAVLTEHTGDVKSVAWHPTREVVASGSYDDTVRLWRDVEEEGDWCCIGVIEGHSGTVWSLAWEGAKADASQAEHIEPRLASCSDDRSIRLWRRELSEAERLRGATGGGGLRMPSIIRPASNMETWVSDAILPSMHVRSIYAIAWSCVTGLIVSCGGDGAIYVYKEVFISPPEDSTTQSTDQKNVNADTNGISEDVTMQNSDAGGSIGTRLEQENHVREGKCRNEWIVIAQMEAAHGDFEINHVSWATRQDRDRRNDDEEVIISTGDDGVVRIWTL